MTTYNITDARLKVSDSAGNEMTLEGVSGSLGIGTPAAGISRQQRRANERREFKAMFRAGRNWPQHPNGPRWQRRLKTRRRGKGVTR